MQEFNIGRRHENFNIELHRSRGVAIASMPDGPAAPSVFNATDRTCGPVICSYNYDRTGFIDLGRGVRGDNRGQINRFGFRVFQFQ